MFSVGFLEIRTLCFSWEAKDRELGLDWEIGFKPSFSELVKLKFSC